MVINGRQFVFHLADRRCSSPAKTKISKGIPLKFFQRPVTGLKTTGISDRTDVYEQWD